jgi:hypothetical protein
VEDRAVTTHVVPAASPFEFTVPANRVVQLTSTGGSGVSVAVSTDGGANYQLFWPATGAQVLGMPGEILRIAWTTTAPVTIRTRALMQIVP